MPPVSKISIFLSALEESLRDGSFVKLSLADYKGPEDQLKNILVRKVQIKREEKLSFTYRYKTRDIVKNYSLPEGISRIHESFSDGFNVATLFTNVFDLSLANKSLKKKAPSHTAPASSGHDRDKKRLIGTKNKAYLHALNITDAQGEVFKSAQDKYRQINRYVEILSSLIQGIAPDRLKKIVDMGSGKGYLTFALYDYLIEKDLHPEVIGVEYRADLVALCNRIAVDAQFTGLHFSQGSIADYDCTDANILIALHACDTATDDAIYKGITAGAELIVVAPCCHKQIRREIEKSRTHNDLDFLMKHGIFVERQAEMVTDGLRALILEYFGYTTKVFEFISDAHTPKNVLIVGTRNKNPPSSDPAILESIKAAKVYFGIETHHLEKILGL
ncbi:MAG: SAM-dependent methyltransferase [Pseudomonadota bacterium]|nr:SAM-dependent methyltransferase [Pseudomonadota bacterium]